jgi:simple sugar transport system permease protein
MRKISKENILGLVLVGIFLLMALFAEGFLDSYNLQNMMNQLPEMGILSIGMMVVILTSGIDLSITFTAALSGVIIALCLSHGFSIPISVLAGLAVALGCGLLNGFFVAYIGVSPILVTLGSMTLFEGIILSITKGNSISGFPTAYSVLGNGSIGLFPISILIFAVLAMLTAVLLQFTKWGRSVYMIGNNPVVTLFSGIQVKRVLIWVYLFSAVMSTVAAVIMTSRYNSAKVDLGSSYLLLSVAAAVLGGTDIAGGYGKVLGTVYAVGIFQVLSNGLNLLGVPRTVLDIVIGLILIAVLTMNFFMAKSSWKRSVKKERQNRVKT